MALTIKTSVAGEGDSNVSVEYADEYFAKRVNARWASASVGAKEAALVSATDYIAIRFVSRYLDTVLEADFIPTNLKAATAEYALRALDAPLLPDPVAGPAGVTTVLTRKKIGPIEKEYEVIGKPRVFRSYPMADRLMAPLLKMYEGRVIR